MPGQVRNKPSERPGRRERSARTTADILRVLTSAKTPMSAYALLAALRGDRINAPTTVYRALSQLIEDGAIHRVESLGAYVICERARHHHGPTAFAICRDCGRVEELPGFEVVRRLRRSAIRVGFQVEATMIELTGSCASCAQ
jgi:Fur family zinc uptake transcriptional regulator